MAGASSFRIRSIPKPVQKRKRSLKNFPASVAAAVATRPAEDKRPVLKVAQDFADYFIVMQVDQAGWHRAKDLQVPENMRLIFQPAYSPEVNPVEHLWEEVREKYLHNRVFSSLDELIEVLCQALTDLTE